MKYFTLILLSFSTFAGQLNFETTRLKSTAGAGVGSILMNEATILNPAPLALFTVSSIYLEKYSQKSDIFDSKSDNYAVIASDTSKNLKGSIAYIKSNEAGLKNSQMNIALASTMGQRSSAGISYKSVKKQYFNKGELVSQNYKMLIPGVFHAVNDGFTFGIVAVDPTRKTPNETKAIIGLQYQFLNYITLMADFGSDWKRDFNESSLYKVATQFKILSDFYLRFGVFDDKSIKQKGTGFGLGWVQPKLVIDFAIKNTKLNEDIAFSQSYQNIKESSFSLSYRF